MVRHPEGNLFIGGVPRETAPRLLPDDDFRRLDFQFSFRVIAVPRADEPIPVFLHQPLHSGSSGQQFPAETGRMLRRFAPPPVPAGRTTARRCKTLFSHQGGILPCEILALQSGGCILKIRMHPNHRLPLILG